MRGADAGSWYDRAVYPLQYDDAIRESSRHNDLDPALVAAVIYAESRFDAGARSDLGAVGLMQVLPETAEQIAGETGGVDFETDDLTDPEVNVRYGTYYLRTVLDQFDGDVVAAVAAYNAGAGVVQEWVDEAQRRRPRPAHPRHPLRGDARLRAQRARGAHRVPAHLRGQAAAALVRAAAARCEHVFVWVE